MQPVPKAAPNEHHNSIMSLRPSPFENIGARQSPFRRQDTTSSAAARATTASSSPTKATSNLSPVKSNSLSPEKTSPFIRRPSQISHTSERPSSPFARPLSSQSIGAPSFSKASNSNQHEALRGSPQLSPATLPPLRRPSIEVGIEGQEEEATHTTASPSPLPRVDGASSSREDRSLESSDPFKASSLANLRPVGQRTATSSSVSTVKPPVFTAHSKSSKVAPAKLNNYAGGSYNHLPQPLLHSMRESFEVLDSSNTGTVNSAAISEMLSQLGLDNTPAALKDFFPPSTPAQVNLARYLDILSGPLAELSQPDELRAAFEAFDVDDSGQIDVSMLRDALLHTPAQPGEEMISLSAHEVDGILNEFTGRRVFGTKGTHVSKGKGDVFRYRDFMANISSGGTDTAGAEATLAA